MIVFLLVLICNTACFLLDPVDTEDDLYRASGDVPWREEDFLCFSPTEDIIEIRNHTNESHRTVCRLTD